MKLRQKVMKSINYASLKLALLGFLTLLSLIFSLQAGSMAVSFTTVLHADNTLMGRVFWQLRLPQTLTAFSTGGLLALSGLLLQALLGNPLADPYILGVSGGASLGMLLALSAGLAGFWLWGFSFVGALATLCLVFYLSGKAQWPGRLLLVGVMMAMGLGAMISVVLTLSPATALHGMLFWLMGDVSDAPFPGLGLLVLLLAFVYSFTLARPLDVLCRGALQAQVLGVNVKGLSVRLYLLSALLTAVAVTQAGNIGFIGLMVPHACRFLFGVRHRYLVPACVLLGGALLTLAHVLAQQLFAPAIIPVGVITALLGVIVFLSILILR